MSELTINIIALIITTYVANSKFDTIGTIECEEEPEPEFDSERVRTEALEVSRSLFISCRSSFNPLLNSQTSL